MKQQKLLSLGEFQFYTQEIAYQALKDHGCREYILNELDLSDDAAAEIHSQLKSILCNQSMPYVTLGRYKEEIGEL